MGQVKNVETVFLDCESSCVTCCDVLLKFNILSFPLVFVFILRRLLGPKGKSRTSKPSSRSV